MPSDPTGLFPDEFGEDEAPFDRDALAAATTGEEGR